MAGSGKGVLVIISLLAPDSWRHCCQISNHVVSHSILTAAALPRPISLTLLFGLFRDTAPWGGGRLVAVSSGVGRRRWRGRQARGGGGEEAEEGKGGSREGRSKEVGGGRGSIQTAGDMTLRGNARAILSPLFLSQSGFLRKTSQLRNHSNVKAGHKERDKISLYELNIFGSWSCQKKR